MKRKVAQPDHCDWRPLRRSPEYRKKYDAIKWEPTPAPEQIVLREGYKAVVDGSNNPFRLVKIEEIPIHVGCGGECDARPYEEYQGELELYECRKCGFIIYDELGRIEWKQKQ